jgi:hypothetical protein
MTDESPAFQIQDARIFRAAVAAIREAAAPGLRPLDLATREQLRETMSTFTESVIAMQNRALTQLVNISFPTK